MNKNIIIAFLIGVIITLVAVNYLPKFYQLQPHSFGYNAIILLVTISLFITRKEKNEN